MELKKSPLENTGMSQDKSISKESNKFAYKNKNIRITASEDGTLLSITNYKGGKSLNFQVREKISNGTTWFESPTPGFLWGTLLTYCITPEYLVVFAKLPADNKFAANTLDVIYRISLQDLTKYGTHQARVLYRGNLNFHVDRTYDTLYYEENANIKKVYWCEDWREGGNNGNEDNNNLRFINIITEGERFGNNTFTPYMNNEFEFYPAIGKAPRIKVQKKYDQDVDFPSGTVQYFFTYYNINGAETKICQDSPLITLTKKDRGGKVDEKASCSVSIKIYNYSTDFDYIRIYSAVRSSLDGAMAVHIVGDLNITKPKEGEALQPLTFIDTYRNQEQIEANQLYFIGGTPIAAKTIDQKMGTLFAGNIHTSHITLPQIIKDLFEEGYVDEETGVENPYVTIVREGTKENPGEIVDKWTKLVKFVRRGQQYLKNDIITDSKKPDKTEQDLHSLLWWDEIEQVKKNGGAMINYFTSEYCGKGATWMDNIEDDILSADLKSSTLYDNDYQTVYKQTDYVIDGDSIYPYTPTNDSSIRYTGFKFGEIYRFGLQFQDKTGQWTEVVYIGDGECRCSPAVDTVNKNIYYTNAIVKLPEKLISICKDFDYVNYRLVFADPELHNGRNIIAQGILNPTVFSPLNRYMKTSWALPSWSFRPVNGDLPYHHFQRLASYWERTAEVSNIAGYESIYSRPNNGLKLIEQLKEETAKTQDSAEKLINGRKVLLTVIIPSNTTNKETWVYMIAARVSQEFYESGYDWSKLDEEQRKKAFVECKGVSKKVTDAYNAVPNELSDLYIQMQQTKFDQFSFDFERPEITYKDHIKYCFPNDSTARSVDDAGCFAQLLFLAYCRYWLEELKGDKDKAKVSEAFNYKTIFEHTYSSTYSDLADAYSEQEFNDKFKDAWMGKGTNSGVNKEKAFTSDINESSGTRKPFRAWRELLQKGWLFLPEFNPPIYSDEAIKCGNMYNYFDKGLPTLPNLKCFFDAAGIKFSWALPNGVIINIKETQYNSSEINAELGERKQVSMYMKNDALFVDDSIVTFNSPEENNFQQVHGSNLKMNIVGAAYINSNYGKRNLLEAGTSMSNSGGVVEVNSNKYITKQYKGDKPLMSMTAEYSYLDHFLTEVQGSFLNKDTKEGLSAENFVKNAENKTSIVVDTTKLAYFMIHPWESSGSITGISSNNTAVTGRLDITGLYYPYNTLEHPIPEGYGKIKSNKTYNYKIAEQTQYVIGNSENSYLTGPITYSAEDSFLDTQYFNVFSYPKHIEKLLYAKSNLKYLTSNTPDVYPDINIYKKYIEEQIGDERDDIRNPESDVKITGKATFSDFIIDNKLLDEIKATGLTSASLLQIDNALLAKNEYANDFFYGETKKEGDTVTTETKKVESSYQSNVDKQDTVRITYNSSPHLVFSLGLSGDQFQTLPASTSSDSFSNNTYFCGYSNDTFFSDSINSTYLNYPWATVNGFNYWDLIRDKINTNVFEGCLCDIASFNSIYESSGGVDFNTPVDLSMVSNYSELVSLYNNLKYYWDKLNNQVHTSLKANENNGWITDSLFVSDYSTTSIKSFLEVNGVSSIISMFLQTYRKELVNEFPSIFKLIAKDRVVKIYNEDEDGNITESPAIDLLITILYKYKVVDNKDNTYDFKVKGVKFPIRLKHCSYGIKGYNIEYSLITSKQYYRNGQDLFTWYYGSELKEVSRTQKWAKATFENLYNTAEDVLPSFGKFEDVPFLKIQERDSNGRELVDGTYIQMQDQENDDWYIESTSDVEWEVKEVSIQIDQDENYGTIHIDDTGHAIVAYKNISQGNEEGTLTFKNKSGKTITFTIHT